MEIHPYPHSQGPAPPTTTPVAQAGHPQNNNAE